MATGPHRPRKRLLEHTRSPAISPSPFLENPHCPSKRLSRRNPDRLWNDRSIKEASRIAVLPVGYADGYDRGLSSKGEVIIGGFRCRVVGRVCMNMLMVDVSNVPDVAPEMEVVLLGRSGRNERTANDLAEAAGTISYEILARLPSHIPRLVV